MGADINKGLSWKHWFGTDALGRDLFTRVLYGVRISLMIGFVTTFINMVLGVLYGGIAGFVGGKADMLLMRMVVSRTVDGFLLGRKEMHPDHYIMAQAGFYSGGTRLCWHRAAEKQRSCFPSKASRGRREQPSLP